MTSEFRYTTGRTAKPLAFQLPFELNKLLSELTLPLLTLPGPKLALLELALTPEEASQYDFAKFASSVVPLNKIVFSVSDIAKLAQA